MPTVDDNLDSERLRKLITRVAGRDQDAFIAVYDEFCGRLRPGLSSRLGDPTRAAGVLVATFVEVWWLAGLHVDPGSDTKAWVNGIVERRVAEGAGAGAIADVHTRSTETELAGLLGRSVHLLRR